MKNKIQDLNNHLFAQLERLGDEDLSIEDLQKEIQRSQAITQIASTFVESAKITVEAMKVLERAGHSIENHGNILMGKSDKT